MDVKISFLHGLLKKEVYVEQPLRFKVQDSHNILLQQDSLKSYLTWLTVFDVQPKQFFQTSLLR